MISGPCEVAHPGMGRGRGGGVGNLYGDRRAEAVIHAESERAYDDENLECSQGDVAAKF